MTTKERFHDKPGSAHTETRGEPVTGLPVNNILGGIAHEIRNALFTTGMTLEALEAGGGEATEVRDIADSLRRQLIPLQELAADLSLLEAPPASGFVSVPFATLLGAALEKLNGGSTAESKARVEVAQETDGRPRVMAEAASMVRALEHILAYAVQRSPSDAVIGPRIRQANDGENQLVECLVDDFGPQLGPEDLQRLFDAYHPASRGGFALRLAAAQGVAEVHGGRLFAEPAPDGGVRLVLRLPCVKEH